MRVIAIGDIHGKSIWEKIVEKESTADKIIFIGDYFDGDPADFTTEYHNFIRILDYKALNPDKVTLLFGNHDIHYHTEFLNINESYSRFQKTTYLEISRIINDNLDKFQMCYQIDNTLFTHAGITKTWLTSTLKDGETIDSISIVDHINNLFVELIHEFTFCGYNRTGDDVTQSPVWVRPKSLYANCLTGYNQVVGHTRFKEIKSVETMDTNNILTFIDVLDVSNDYLVIEDSVLSFESATI